jgi:hypothetical protein
MLAEKPVLCVWSLRLRKSDRKTDNGVFALLKGVLFEARGEYSDRDRSISLPSKDPIDCDTGTPKCSLLEEAD